MKINISISFPHWLYKTLVISLLSIVALICFVFFILSIISIWPIWWPRLTNAIPVVPSSPFEGKSNAYAIFVEVPKEIRAGDTFQVTVRGQIKQSITPVSVDIDLVPYNQEDEKFIHKIELVPDQVTNTPGSNKAGNAKFQFKAISYKIQTVSMEFPPSELNVVIQETVTLGASPEMPLEGPIKIHVDRSPFPSFTLAKICISLLA